MSQNGKKTIINLAGIHLGFIITEDTWSKDVINMHFLEEFLEKENSLILCALLEEENDNKRLKFLNNITSLEKRHVILFKNKQNVLNEENLFDSVTITSVQGSATAALYHSLNRLFVPLISKNESKKSNIALIERQLTTLQAGLRASLLISDSIDDPINNEKNDSISVVLSVDHEVEYWHNIANTSKSKEHVKSSTSFRDILMPLAKNLSILDALQMNDVEDTLENAHNILDDLWRHEPPYPKARIEHLMEIIANDILNYINKQVNNFNIWKEDYNVMIDFLEQSSSLGERWISSCRELTEIFWPNYSLHTWTSSPYVPINLTDLVKRLKEIISIRAVHKQLIKLLTISEQEELNTSELFKPFQDINSLQYGRFNEQAWVTAVKQHEYLLEPVERKVALKLKSQFSSINANTRQLLYEFGRYSNLISRSILKNTLLTERQYLLNLLHDYVKELSKQTSDTPILSSKYDTPQVVAEILHTRTLQAKVMDIKNVSQLLLNDLHGYEEINQQVLQLIKELKNQNMDLYDSWTSEIITRIKDKSLSLSESDPVVRFSSNKLMKVNYSPRLVSLISEVRQFSALGYNVPDLIIKTSEHAKRFMNYAKYLEQIANFHNTIGDRMITSQRPMMLPGALELARLVQEQEVVSWGNLNAVEKYVDSLKTAVDKLSSENNLLTSYHSIILEKINDLYNVDLLKHYDKWKSSTKSMRDIVNQVQQKGFKSSQQWKVDLDKHLSKALEAQYSKSLDQVHLYLPEIYTELIYRDHELLFSPNETALREKYDQQLKKFLDIPVSFRGISDNVEGNVFISIPDRCKDKLEKLKINTDTLFGELEAVKKHWKSWLTLDALDTSKLLTWQNWDLHFRSSKTFGQEIAKLPSVEEKIGCFVISLSRLRSDLESHNRSYWDKLVESLKDSIIQHVLKLQEYVDTSTGTLNKQPLTIEQIGEADASHSNILTQKPEMDLEHQEMVQKAHVLASWTRERIDSVNRLQGGWERLQNLLENYEHIISKQVETVKTTLQISSKNLNLEMERFSAKWGQIRPKFESGHIALESIDQLQNHLENVKEKKLQWKELIEQKDKIIMDYKKFNLEPDSNFDISEEIEKELNEEESVWTLFEEFYQDLQKLMQEEWIIFRKKIYKFEDFLINWKESLQKMTSTPLITRLLQEIHKYQEIFPSLKYLKGEDFTEKHWMEVFGILSINPKPLDVITLQDFLKAGESLISKKIELQGVCKKAASEIVVRQALSELDQWDVQAQFELNNHNDVKSKPVMLIKNFKDVLNKIGDNQSLLQSVKNSSDFESFSERASMWENRLNDLDRNITSLMHIQRKWVYLEPIFMGGTLDQEKNRFDKVDRDVRHILKFVEKDSRVCALLRYSNLRAVLNNLSDQLSRCQNSLDEFLAEKRNKFPRFLFLGDDDLLEIVGQSSKEQVIQTHLKKLFAGIHSIVMDEEGKNIIAMKSLQGEVVKLSSSIDINQPIEDWLNNLVKEMQSSIKQLLIECMTEGNSPDPLKYPSQILCLAEYITFTTKCEQAISSMSLSQLLATYKAQLAYYSTFGVNEDKENSLPNTDDEEVNILDIKLKALLLDTIYYINIIEDLLESNVNKITDWKWQRQLRFYCNSSGQVTIKMVNARIEYAYEYIGNVQKLVRTALTDKCFLTLTQAMHLGLGGNPYGPAGTGKTESVKSLGSLLGRQVLVFNCDEGIDAASMGRILSGLVRCGAWGCFDEFNRLDEATLSAITMYIQPIQNALKTQKSTVSLLDQEIQVNKHCGIFVTLNPASGDYGGRNKLPDNLKQLFRPVIMSHPDHEDIARTLLYCDGFRDADVIGRKLVELFSLASKLLSKQQHYDWGLRALRTVLGGCGKNMKEALKTTAYNNITKDLEFAMIVQAVKRDTLSKLTFSDCKIFCDILENIFPSTNTEEFKENDLITLLCDSQIELGLLENKRQISKCLELYEQLRQRMGVSVVGPAMSGKTTIQTILFHALRKLGKNVKKYTLNPKAITRNQLLGQIDSDSRQWTDGVLTQYSLNAVNEPADVWTCIVCDGDIDPDWVESLNSVLDDNRIMTLPSGWRIQFGPNVNFIFETDNLSYASPATISRMGITFLSEEDVDLKSYIDNFLKTLAEDNEKILSSYINDYLYKAIDWVITEAEIVIKTPKVSLTKTVLSQMKNVTNKSEFIIGLLNGLGGHMEHDFREIFSQLVFEWVNENAPSTPLRACYSKTRDMIESYFTTPNQNLELIEYHIPLVLTSQVQQTVDTLRTWLEMKEEHFLVVGQHGSAKRLIIEYITKEKSDAEISIIHCSEYVQTQYVIQKILQYCVVVNSNIGKIYKPRKGHLILYFKNMHLLKEDKWGTNMILSFLQQLIVYHGFFDNNLEWATIQNVTIVGTLNATNNLSKRFTSLMNIYNVELPQDEDLKVIYFNYLTSILKKCGSYATVWTKSAISKLTTTILSIYNVVKETFLEIDQQHYSFSPHDLTKWCEGLIRYKVVTNDVESGILEVICHEALRIFYDFLGNENDKQKFLNILQNKMSNDWSKSKIVTTALENYYIASTQSGLKKDFTTLMKLNSEDWKTIVRKGISQYEREGVKMDVEIIPELLYLTATLSRALTSSNGNCLLVGNAGIGRHSAVRIIAALQNAKVIIPSSNQNTNFKKDFKTALHYAGVEGEEVYFLLEDHILSKNEVLNVINIFISSGEFPTLYNPQELETLLAALKDEAGRVNYDGNLYEFFVERARKKLHVVLCLEHENESISKILKSCPCFFQNTCVVWLNKWSKGSENFIAKQLIQRFNEKREDKDLFIQDATNLSKIQDFVSTKLATPLRFIILIKTYINIYEDKRETIMEKRKKLEAGVLKLTEAGEVVANLKLKAADQQIKLSEKQTKANRALDMISNTMKNANVHKEEMETLKNQTEKENIQIVKRKQEIEVELSEVEPLIQEARNAVGNIKTESLSEIRSLRAPPEVIRDILEGVLRLMGIQDTSWNSMKTFLAKRGIKEDIRSFNASRITTESRLSVEKLLQNKKESFDPKSSKRASVAAAPLAAWVLANVRYSKVLEKIKPLEKEQNRLEKNLTEAKSQLSELSAGLLDVDATVEKLKNQLATYTREAAEIEISLGSAQATLASAEGLVAKLNDEYERWKSQLKELEISLKRLSAFSLLSAAFITYLSQDSEDVRLSIMNQWTVNLSYDVDFSLEDFLSSEREQLQWQSEGLSTDKLSIQNAIIILKTKLCPFLIDPTSMAVDWIKNKYKNKNFDVTTPDSSKFNNNLELAVRFGKILLIEEVEEVPSCLFAILRKQFVNQGERTLVNLNGKLIDYNKDFQLILSSRNAHLQLTADVSAVVSIINFTTTRAGLSQQLLISAVRQENPELEKRRKDLLKQSEDYVEKQYKLQNQLLEDLVNSTGDILQNKNLLQSLNETKASSSEITKALNESLEVQAKLQEEFNVYSDISKFGSDLYFAISEFSNTNIIYSISVSSYIILFLKSLPSLEGSQNTQYYIQKTLIQAVYQSIGKGIFKSDRLQLLMYLLYRMFPEHVPKEEWDFLIGNSIAISKSDSNLDKKSILWLPEQTVNHIIILQSSFPKLYNNLLLSDENLWKDFMHNSKCESNFPPHCKLTEFQKLIVVQILRSDRFYSAMCACVQHLTGIKSLHLDIIQLSQVYKDSYCQQPILLLSTSGNDPSGEIKDLCNNLGKSDNFVEVCMGEGQELKAISYLQDCANLGNWLVLKNLHLVTSWLPILCQELRSLKANQNFRLWLITENHQKFSSVLAENSLKIAYEPPAGVKSNIFKTFTSYGKEYVEKLNSSAARIFFAISCIHAVFQERRNFIPQGWSKWYEFGETDLTTLIKLSEEIWQVQGSQIPWKYLKGWSLEAIYGGRIENSQDLIILSSYLEQYFNDEVLSHRWKPLCLSNHLPSTSNYKDYLNIISQLSDKDIPAYFGLSENIERAWERNFSSHITKSLKDMVLLKNMPQKLNKEAWYKNLSPFISLWKKLNHGHDFTRVSIPVQNLTGNPIEIFISEEFRNALILIQKIHKHFAMLNKIAKGYVGYGEEYLEIANSLFGLKTPLCWLKLWNGPKEPIGYLKDVIKKSDNITNWVADSGTFTKKLLNLSLLFNPDTFLAACKQNFARENEVPLDDLEVKTGWKEVKNSMVLSNLLMEGAIFDGLSLTPCTPQSESVTSAGECYITWQTKSIVDNDRYLEVPLYYTSSREQELMKIQVPCNHKEKSKWIQSGIAFFLTY